MCKKTPSRTKYKKTQNNFSYKISSKCNSIEFGSYALQSIDYGLIKSSSLESARIAINHKLKRSGTIICRIFPHTPITKKAAETRMGKGKGEVDSYACFIKKGTVIFEIKDVPFNLAKEALSLGERKLNVKCKFIYKMY
jgi:large subunit ribosomal protein L16